MIYKINEEFHGKSIETLSKLDNGFTIEIFYYCFNYEDMTQTRIMDEAVSLIKKKAKDQEIIVYLNQLGSKAYIRDI